jgi:hypothetical protein
MPGRPPQGPKIGVVCTGFAFCSEFPSENQYRPLEGSYTNIRVDRSLRAGHNSQMEK